MTLKEPLESTDVEAKAGEGRKPSSILRVVVVAAGLVLWFWTQSLIAGRGFPEKGIGDAVHEWTAPIHSYFLNHARAADGLLISSSLLINFLAVFILASAIFGPSIRPFLGLLILFALRQVCQSLCALPPPEGMIWRYPGFPGWLVTYGTSNDLFFSGHTAMAVYGVLCLGKLGRPFQVLGVLIAVFEIGTVLVLRAHYTMDVFTGAITAFFAFDLAGRLSAGIDRRLSYKRLP